ncbi:centrosomal protein of 104 kDa isoform X1 [Pleuronectes platessa]|uniref:centrosomal protein of 104 kDa isoform X1 n=2 Tax=Pleuronectes platessa TaxID=8262 RepID=UPI00232A22B8|nr:centrosomal protein of 104 kDa isoform X1 [Pleuronectes platessa]XP_053281302.1 centrosomal protein of 104 kDa isoform X1 [Pleuronectes platessa]XP_053281303.1 centrosomal protein of 104 kDa isoform X1 [Pleuronectes platessa]
MPGKIGFIVVNSSSHEGNFTAKELMVHAPTATGWRSSRLCSYPQHVTLQLVERSRVRKLQLLAHQYLIPAKVEFHIGDSLPETSSPGQLRRLGYVPLSDNEKTGFIARELKSVYVDAIGTYLRITFHKNHVNSNNQHNQVALVAINVLGDSLDGNAFNTIPSREQLIDHYLSCTQQEAALDTTFMGLTPSKYESFSPFDDLAFEMYQDPQVAHLIRLMDQQKQDMVQQEKYEQAKYLRQAIADLQKVGERLARYDVEKQCAIEKEDYDLAKKKKELMEEYRRSVYQQLEDCNLLDTTMIARAMDPPPLPDPPPLLPSPGHCSVPIKPLVSTDTNKKEKKANTPQKQQSATEAAKRSCQRDSPSTPAAGPKLDSTSSPHDDRPLPAQKRKEQPVETVQSPPEQQPPDPHPHRSPPSSEMSGEPEPLTEQAHREAGLPIDVYGESVVAWAYSKSWSNRENALLAVHKRLLEVSSTTPKEELRKMIRAAVLLVKKALQDKVSSVLQASLMLLRLMLNQLIPGLGLGRSEVIHCVEQTWPDLLLRTGDPASRLRAVVSAFIQEIAVLKDVRALQVIPADLVKAIKFKSPPRLAQSRVELLEKLLAELGTENSGFTVDNVMTFCAVSLKHTAPPVREAAQRIVLSMYQQHRSAILSYLPGSDDPERNSFLYKTLFDGFAKIDGKLVETQTLKKGGGQQEGQKEKEEIHTLQEQLAALKEITERSNEGTKGQMTKKETPRVEKESQKAGRATVSKVPQNKMTDRAEVQQSSNCLDNLCIFCGKKDESYTEDGLDLHYWKHCPMLRRCSECRQVVEIASLTEHLLGECESNSKFSQCPRCSEAVASEDLTRHVQGPSCNSPVSGKGSNHCPLCHNNFMPGEEAWKAHLMGREGCKQNSRRTAVSQRTQPAQGRAVGGAKLKQAWSVGARGRPIGRGSRIPALAPLARGHSPGKR